MKIWKVCEVHDSQAHPDYPRRCWAFHDDAWLEGQCVIVPMRLIPDNAETVELGVNEIITEVDRLEQLVKEMPQPVTHRQVIARVLLDFNERALDGETDDYHAWQRKHEAPTVYSDPTSALDGETP